MCLDSFCSLPVYVLEFSFYKTCFLLIKKKNPFASSRNYFCFIIFLFLNEATSLFQLGAAAVNLVAGEKPLDVYS